MANRSSTQPTYSSCPACGGTKIKHLTKRTAKGKDYYLARCSGCGQHYSDPALSAAEIVAAYQGDYHSELREPGGSEKCFGPKYESYRDWVLLYLKGGRSLDIGTATGLFPSLLKRAGFDAEGLEYNPLSAEWGRQHYGIEIRTCSLEESGAAFESYDLVSMTDVLEHAEHPLRYLQSVRRYVKPGGLMLITFPDISSLESVYFRCLAWLFRRDWIWFQARIPYHVWEFTPATARAMFGKAGLEVIGFRRTEFPKLPATDPLRLRVLALPTRLLSLPGAGRLAGGQMQFLLRKPASQPRQAPTN